jgi:short subunit fatty acids transporter
VSVAVAWQFTAMLSAEMGLSGALAELAAGPGRVLAELARQMPEGQSVLALLGRVRDLSMWLLMVAILWRLGEQYGPRTQRSVQAQS